LLLKTNVCGSDSGDVYKSGGGGGRSGRGGLVGG